MYYNKSRRFVKPRLRAPRLQAVLEGGRSLKKAVLLADLISTCERLAEAAGADLDSDDHDSDPKTRHSALLRRDKRSPSLTLRTPPASPSAMNRPARRRSIKPESAQFAAVVAPKAATNTSEVPMAETIGIAADPEESGKTPGAKRHRHETRAWQGWRASIARRGFRPMQRSQSGSAGGSCLAWRRLRVDVYPFAIKGPAVAEQRPLQSALATSVL